MQVAPIENTSSSRMFRFIVEPKETNSCIERASRALSTARAIKGFRRGEAPFHILIKVLPRNIVHKEILSQALSLVTKKLSQMEEKSFGMPLIKYKGFENKERAIHLDMPLEFTITLANEPLVTIPLYRDARVRQEKVEVTEKEIEEVTAKFIQERQADMIDDEFARPLGGFKNLERLQYSIKESLMYKKTTASLAKARDELLENIRNKSAIDIAPFLIEREAEALISQQIKEVQSRGLDFDEYVKKVAKDKENFVAQMRRRAEVNIKNWLILKKIAQTEGITVKEDEIEKYIKDILSAFSRSKEAQKELNLDGLKERVREELLQEKVFTEILDKQIIAPL